MPKKTTKKLSEKTKLARQIRQSEQHILWSRKVRTRDKFVCQICGGVPKRKRNIHAHHILSFASNPDLRFNLDNGLTVCKRCHRGLHSAIKTPMKRRIGDFPLDYQLPI